MSVILYYCKFAGEKLYDLPSSSAENCMICHCLVCLHLYCMYTEYLHIFCLALKLFKAHLYTIQMLFIRFLYFDMNKACHDSSLAHFYIKLVNSK